MDVSAVMLEGFDEIREAFLAMTDSIQRKHMRAAVRAGGALVIREARSRLRARDKANRRKRKSRTRKGKPTIGLARALRQIPSSRWRSSSQVARKGIIATTVGAKWPEGAHAHLVEYGHRMVTHDKREVGTVPAYPFFRPAIEATRSRVNAIMIERLRKGIEMESKKTKKPRKRKAR